MMKIHLRILVIVSWFVCAVSFGGDFTVSLPEGESAVVNGCFNAEGNRLSGWLMRTDGHGSFELTSPQTGSPDPVLTMKVRTADPKPWMMELRQPVGKVVEKGCTMYITFEYKMTKGYSFQFYWQEEHSPWPKLLSMRLTTPANAWHRIRVAAPVHATYQPAETAFSFHLAEAPGILQVRNFYAVMVPNTYNPEHLETNESAVLGGDFYDREWREKVQEKMKSTRMVPLRVRVHKLRKGAVRSRNHPPAVGAVVIMKQQSRPLRLGVSAQAALMRPELLSRPEHAALRSRLGSHAGNVQAYRSQILGNPLFSGVWLLGPFGWKEYSAWGKDVVRSLCDEIRGAGQALGGGALYEPRFSQVPESYRKADRGALNRGLLEHVTAAVSGLSGKVASWAVLHDAIAHSEVYNYIGVDSLAQAFGAAQKADGKASLFVSDSHALNGLSEVSLLDMVELVTWLRDTAEVKVDGLLLSGCLQRLDVGPQTLEKRLNLITKRLPDMPIHIVDLSVNMDKEDYQGEMLRDCLLLFYACPQVKSVSLGELWSPAARLNTLGYLREDFTPKRSYEMLKKLLTEEWISTAELKTNDVGMASCELYGGSYEVMVAFETMTKRFTIDIPDGYQLQRGELYRKDGVVMRYSSQYGLTLDIYLNRWKGQGNTKK